MKIEISIDESIDETKIIVLARELTPDIAELVKRLSQPASSDFIVGYAEETAKLIVPSDIVRIYAEGQRVYARTVNATYLLKLRLYELEEMFLSTKLIRTSNSEIVNFQYSIGLDLSISGTITIKLSTGEKAFVSRRYVDKIKKRLGI